MGGKVFFAGCGGLQRMSRQAPFSCPICGRTALEQLFDDIQITANMNYELRNVGGLEAFMCSENRHVFFVMKKDNQQESASGRVTST